MCFGYSLENIFEIDTPEERINVHFIRIYFLPCMEVALYQWVANTI